MTAHPPPTARDTSAWVLTRILLWADAGSLALLRETPVVLARGRGVAAARLVLMRLTTLERECVLDLLGRDTLRPGPPVHGDHAWHGDLVLIERAV